MTGFALCRERLEPYGLLPFDYVFMMTFTTFYLSMAAGQGKRALRVVIERQRAPAGRRMASCTV